MFTGIVEEIGIVKSIKRGTKSAVLNIQAEGTRRHEDRRQPQYQWNMPNSY